GGGGAGLGDSLPTEQTISDETAVETCSNLFGKEIVEQLESKAWKSRLEAMEAIKTKLNDQIGSEIPCQAAVRVISNAVKPGLKDNNFQVLKLRLETLSYLAANAQFTRTSADACLEEIYDKIGDAKVGDSAKACLTAIAEACSLDYVGVQLAQTVFKLKNPKNQSEALNWLAQSVLEFGLRIPPKELIKYVRQGFAATNPAIRQAAISLTVSLYMYIGDSLRSLLADEKPALLQQIDQEIEQIKDKKPPAPTRGLKHAAAAASGKSAGKAAAGGGANADAGDDDEDDAAGVEDLVPRVDLADKLTDATVAKLGDSNWKIRKEGLDEVRALLNECRLVTSNLGELPERLRQRLADSNKVLCSQAMEISEALAPALGKRHAKNPAVHRPIVSGIVLNGMSDAKPRQRQIACQALNAWCEQVGLALLAEGDLFVEALRKENPFLRAELLGWLAEKLMTSKSACQQSSPAYPTVAATCAKKATEAIAPIIICIGWDSVMRAWKKLPPASQGDVRAILDKEREKAAAEAPTAPAPARAPPPPAASSSKPSSATSTSRNASAGAKKSATRASEESSSAGGGGGGSGAASKRKSGSTAALSAAADKKAAAAAAEDAGPIAPIQVNKMREQRLSDEKKRKVLRWDFSGGQPERDHIQQLQRQMTDAGFSSELLGQLFHQDFRQHIKAIESLSAYLDNGGDDAAEGHRCNVDLILKWSAARFYDTNPSMVMRCLEYLNRLFQVMMDREWLLNDSDAQAFFPHLLIKLGEPKDVIRRDVKSLFGKANRVYPASKLFLYFMDGLAAKSAKQRQECLDELGKIIQPSAITRPQVQGIGVCQPTPAQAMKAIAKQIGDRDNGVRNAALNTLLVAYRFIGEPLLKMSSGVGSNSATTSRPGTAPSASAAPAQVNSATITRRGGGGGGGGGGSGGGMFQLEAPELDPMPVVPGDSEYDMNAEEEEMNRPVEFPKLARKPAEEDLTLKSSPDAFTAITHVITQVSSTDSKLVCSAVRQLIEVMLDEDRCKLLSGHVDPILLAVTNQISLNTEPADPVGTLDLLRSLLYCLSTVFHVAVLAKCASKDRLKSVFQSAISLVISDSLTRLDPSDADHVNRTVNQLCASVIANADRTRVLLSLLRSLYECVDRVGFSQLFTELNIKCLWRITRELDKHVAEYDWDSVLAECNAFLTSFPLESWQQPDGDAPLRAVTNLLHKLCQLKGRDANPDTDLKPYLSKASAFFNRYIEQGLRSIEKERLRAAEQQQQQQQAVSALMSTGGQLPKGSGGQLASEMLAKLREFERTHLLNHSQPDQL
uniref:Cytoskeleton-associated protein 5 n=1 Tax=Macrostomum lignano TaxID=282301 RepID=A0A1I8ITA7_9PLAT